MRPDGAGSAGPADGSAGSAGAAGAVVAGAATGTNRISQEDGASVATAAVAGGGVSWRVSFDQSELAALHASAPQRRVKGELCRRVGVSLAAGADGVATISDVLAGAEAGRLLAVGDRVCAVNGRPTPAHDVKAVERMILEAMAGPQLQLEMQAPPTARERAQIVPEPAGGGSGTAMRRLNPFARGAAVPRPAPPEI